MTIGANIGTTVTGFLAALAVAGPNAAVGLQIALVHLLFNVAGMMLILPHHRDPECAVAFVTWCGTAGSSLSEADGCRDRFVILRIACPLHRHEPGVVGDGTEAPSCFAN